ncbi:MAG TPA: hypothetical protein PLX20_12300 [Rhodocyclaceae bacterium]|nr:hypothetical protein [Rhodocyclaceae bacterium]HMZ83613.1 hypothetical protein [Rhodocyclaceae bacterium]HNB77279.1 hypothetical protein [Rhodocyclaceae bacterium]HNC61963.1 hypothetical protein [Rhodocyclaceae bacterium]HNH13914.1 hypothetical protein [Rhodocyclaceae bacterium]
MKIAILGWGSLLWDDDREFDAHHDKWKLDGPLLPIEFSRISTSRHGALTLVVDPSHGTRCQVAYALSKRRTIEDAVADLRCREHTTMSNIGFLQPKSAKPPSLDQQTWESLQNWVCERKIDAVVWTALTSNFKTKTGLPFSTENAVKYLSTLDSHGRSEADNYIARAPSFVVTPLRRMLSDER